MDIFIGSSSEKKVKMRKIANWIKETGNNPKCWNEPELFLAGKYTLSNIFRISQQVEASVLIFGEEDLTWYREKLSTSPRDNVLVEFGIFAKALGEDYAIICYTGSPRMPTDLDGLTSISLSRADAKKKFLAWINNLKTKSTLEKIKENVLSLERKKTVSFQKWLYERHLVSVLNAIQPIHDQSENDQKGTAAYKHQVNEHLSDKSTEIVLALCGKKFDDLKENRSYFETFYKFAKKQHQKSNKQLRDRHLISMCRIFLQDEHGGFSPGIDGIIKDHQKRRKTGVLGLTIDTIERRTISRDFDESFCQCLDSGFGFLFFYKPNAKSIVITHEGIENNLAFVVLKDRLNVAEILNMFKILCQKSNEYNIEQENLYKLFNRIQFQDK